MPFKRRYRKKRKGKDAKQDSRIKKLESLVLKTIENKQVNIQDNGRAISSGGYSTSQFLQLATGAEDGSIAGDPARIGNTITLMAQRFWFNFKVYDNYNQFRVLVVESLDGNESIALSDVLQYPSYATYGDLVFNSPYTTKTSTNKRYKIHMDKHMVLSNTVGGNAPVRNLKLNIKWKNGKLVEYSGPGTVHPTNHRMNLLVISDSTAPNHPEMSWATRATYKDA